MATVDRYRIIFYTVRDPLAFPAAGQIDDSSSPSMPVDFPTTLVEGFGARAFQQYRIISDKRYNCPHGAFNEHPFPDGETYGLVTALASSNKPMTRYFHFNKRSHKGVKAAVLSDDDQFADLKNQWAGLGMYVLFQSDDQQFHGEDHQQLAQMFWQTTIHYTDD